jgi:hypothetical protein
VPEPRALLWRRAPLYGRVTQGGRARRHANSDIRAPSSLSPIQLVFCVLYLRVLYLLLDLSFRKLGQNVLRGPKIPLGHNVVLAHARNSIKSGSMTQGRIQISISRFNVVSLFESLFTRWLAHSRSHHRVHLPRCRTAACISQSGHFAIECRSQKAFNFSQDTSFLWSI